MNRVIVLRVPNIFVAAAVFFAATGSVLASSPRFVGQWGEGQEACKIRESYTITHRGFADDLTGQDACVFTRIVQTSKNTWTIDAMCGAEGSANGERIVFKFQTTGNSLDLSGGYRAQNWVRCK